MLRILRAFAWMRWRVLVNSLERTGARDTIERLSLAVEQLGPIMAAALLVPSTIGLAGLSLYAGYTLAGADAAPLAFEMLRYVLFAASAVAVIGPIMLPAAERTNAVRLLLLPIPRSALYITQAATTVADPWILLLLPTMVFLPVGLAAGGAVLSAIAALAAGILFVAICIGLSSLTMTVVHFVFRDRRRGELLALLFILVIPMIGMLPGLLHGAERRDRRAGRGAPEESIVPTWVERAGWRLVSAAPSELYAGSTRAMLDGRPASGAASVAALAATAVALHGLGWLLFGRLLDSPASTGPRRSGPSTATWGRTFPGLSPGASAVAMAQVRLAVRTPRGRSTLLSPIIVFAMFAALMWRSGEGMDMGFIALESGLGLATFGAVVCLLAILPLAMNQFAIDGAGLTLELLSPLADREILTGKAAGNALLVLVPALVCTAGAFAIFPSRPYAFQETSHHRMMDLFKIKTEISYSDIVSPEEGLRKTVQWLLKNRPAPGDEVEVRLQDPFDYAGEDRLAAAYKESIQRMAAVPFNIDTSRPHPYAHPKEPGQQRDHRAR